MGEKTGSPLGGFCSKPSEPLCCISVNKIFDSARDKDCLEDLKVYLSDCAQEVIDRATAIRGKNVQVVWTSINIEPVPFNKGYYQVCIRYYFCVTIEACICNGRSQEVKGLCVYDKKIILFGSEKNVSVFMSDPDNNGFCSTPEKICCDTHNELPSVVVEVASPIILDCKVVEKHHHHCNCCICVDSIPETVRNSFDGNFMDGIGTNELIVSIGLFSIIRMERPVQLMIPGTNFCLPDKDSTPAISSSDPCKVFSKMCFPMSEFFPYAEGNDGKCGR